MILQTNIFFWKKIYQCVENNGNKLAFILNMIKQSYEMNVLKY